MLDPGFKPNEIVVELAAVSFSAATVSGAIAGALVTWNIKRSVLASSGAFFVGGVSGFVVGQAIARMLYRSEGKTRIIVRGVGSLYATVPAGLAGGVAAAGLVGLLTWAILGRNQPAFYLLGIALACGVVLGAMWGCLAALV